MKIMSSIMFCLGKNPLPSVVPGLVLGGSKVALTLVVSVLPLLSFAQTTQTNAQTDEVITLSDTVTGNLEQPSVLFVIPWQSDQDKRIITQPLKSEIDAIFSLVDESEHKREIQFIEALKDK